MPQTRILVIEDDDDARTMYGIMLRSWGYEILEASSGGEGIRAARKQRPDLILLDIMMPDIDGYEVCKQLRADSQFRTIPIIFLSALDAMDDRIKGYTIGGDDFITKGQVDYKELGVRVKAALGRMQRLKVEMAGKRQGTSLGIFSLRGGVGVSTIALNLARHASTWIEQPTILLDMSFPVGSIGLWSGVTGERHLPELLSRKSTDINLTLIQDFCLQNVHGFLFISGPSGVIDLSKIRTEAIQRMLYLLQEEGYFVILDLGRATLPILWQIQSFCNWTAVVTSAESTSRDLASIAIETLPKHNFDPRTMLLVFNDSTNQRPADVTTGLPHAPDIFVPYTKNLQDLPEPSPFTQLLSVIVPQVQEARK
jgi:pilus assembly protein CpaE